MNTPTVSVVMPAFNAERFVAAAVKSILNQTFADFEFVIVNDGSTDQTGSILNDYAAINNRIRLIHQPNAGIVAASNTGMSMACAGLIARMDADDVSRPDRLERQVAYLQAHPECVAVGSRIMTIDPDGLEVCEQFLLTEHEEIDRANLAGRCAMANPSVIMRRSALDRFPPYRGSPFAEDLDLWLRLAERGRLKNLPEVLLNYRLNTGSISYSPDYDRREILQEVLNDACKRRGLPAPERLPESTGRPIPRNEAPWFWARMALYAGRYRSALALARKARRTVPASKSGWATLGLAALGPLGRALLIARNRVSNRS